MRNRPGWIGVALCLLVILGFRPGFAGVKWAQDSFDEILKKAKSENKHVFIDFYATWCGPCKRLDKITYKDKKVSALLNDMIPVKYDAEKGAGVELARQFRVSAYPSLILLTPEGEEIDRHLGFVDPPDFLRIMGGYARGIGTVAYYRAMVEADPSDREAWKTLGTKHANAGRLAEAADALNKFLKIAPDVKGDEKAEVLFALAEVNYQNASYAGAVALYEQMITEFADTDWHDRALTRLARAHHEMGNTDRSIETYKLYVDRHPDDPKALNSFAWFCAQKRIGFEQALPSALKAAELSNRDPGILDTLAELYYAMGEYDKAVEVGREAARKEPKDSYYRDQLEKFRKAKEGSAGRTSK